ncbi:MAG TPA: hypothetical protein VN193_03085 [Candidatus Angelobacter sp.]|jgi:hypothetical protein|nr:hypothetical protein [Candidatus Angelobacter sp.]
MLCDAIRDIDKAVRLDREERERRAAMRASFQRAEGYMWQVEELLEEGSDQVPDPLVTEIARFVRPYSRRLARMLTRDPERNPVQALDVLFDVQERIQRQTMARLGVTEALAS